MATASVPPQYPDELDDQEAVAANIRALMGRYRVSQQRLADAVGISRPGLSDRLNGHTNFTVRELGRVARFFGKSLGDVVTPLFLTSLAIASFTERGLNTPLNIQGDVVVQLSLFEGNDSSTASAPASPLAASVATVGEMDAHAPAMTAQEAA